MFAGHWHTYTKYRRNDSRYFILATTGGGSSLRGPLFGSFDHVVWVTMTESGPRIANLMLDGIWDEDVLTEDRALILSPLLSGSAVLVSPILGDDDRFEKGASEIRLTNDADVPLEIIGSFEDHDLLEASPATFQALLPPNSVEQIQLTVSAGKGHSIDELSPMQLQWQARYTGTEEEFPPSSTAVLTWSSPAFTSCAGVRSRWSWTAICPTGMKLPLDVQRPSLIKFAADSWMGPEDCSWRFAVEYDEDKLYNRRRSHRRAAHLFACRPLESGRHRSARRRPPGPDAIPQSRTAARSA